jgi:hypothetical protein
LEVTYITFEFSFIHHFFKNCSLWTLKIASYLPPPPCLDVARLEQRGNK